MSFRFLPDYCLYIHVPAENVPGARAAFSEAGFDLASHEHLDESLNDDGDLCIAGYVELDECNEINFDDLFIRLAPFASEAEAQYDDSWPVAPDSWQIVDGRVERTSYYLTAMPPEVIHSPADLKGA